MFKQFINPLSRAWEKVLKDHKLSATLRSAMLLLFAVAIIQISMFGAALAGLIILIQAIK